ncbi:hypothetical protein [Paenibacillus sp. FSL R7-0272]|uniref:hypothetical protein n=1 Tax=Paenibacillus sp. FSL R7-0272 TaxID=2921679 RepID=UPI0030DB3D5C
MSMLSSIKINGLESGCITDQALMFLFAFFFGSSWGKGEKDYFTPGFTSYDHQMAEWYAGEHFSAIIDLKYIQWKTVDMEMPESVSGFAFNFGGFFINTIFNYPSFNVVYETGVNNVDVINIDVYCG